MRRILSFILIVSMCLSSIPTSYAMLNENDYRAGTKVEYTATNEESYTITVPAKLSPGQSGTVKLEGSWPQNRVLTVTADKTVTLTNSINTSDTKTLDVYFDGISEQGDNTRAQTFTQSVSVQTIKNALFGTWNGRFNYNVASSNVAVKSEIPVQATDKDGNDLNAKSYVIDGTEKDQLLSELQNSDLIENAENVDALIEIKSDDFEDVADTTFDVSSIAQPGDQVVILHYNEETREWEYISQETVDGEGKVNANFSSYSPVAFVVVQPNGTLAPINPSAAPVYFEHPYSASFMGMYGTYIFHEDGSADLLVSGSLMESAPANTFSYGEGSIVNNNNPDDVFIVHDMDSFTYVVDDDEILFVRENNEVLYNKEYVYYEDGMKITLTFGEDGSAVYSIPGMEPQIFPAGSIKRDNSYIYTEGEEAMRGLVLQSGHIVVIEGTVFKVQGELKELTDYDAKSFYYDFRDVDGYLEISISDMYMLRRVSAATPSLEELSRGSVDIYVEGVLVESIYLTEEDVEQAYENVIICPDFMVFIIEKDNTTISDSNLSVTFPLAGIYVLPLLTAEVGTDNVQVKVCWDLEIPDAPTSLSVDSIAYESITLVEIPGCEYSNNGYDWQDSPVFNNLYAGNTYTFYARYKATATTAPSTTVTVTAQTLTAPQVSIYKKGNYSIEVNPIENAEFSLDLQNWQNSSLFENLQPNTEYVIYARYKATDSLPTSPNSYGYRVKTIALPEEIVFENIGWSSVQIAYTYGCEYSLDGLNWQTNNYFSDLTPEGTYTFYKRYYATNTSYASEYVTATATLQSGAVVPTVKTVAYTSIILNEQEGYEYSLYTGYGWQTSGQFTGLTSGRTYTIYARKQSINGMQASPYVSLEVTTLAPPPNPVVESKTSTTITMADFENVEFRKGSTGEWQDDRIFTGLTPASTVVIYMRYKAYGDIPASGATSISVKLDKSTQEAPVLPVAAEIQSTYIRLVSVSGCEYSLDGITYQSSPLFEGLNSTTSYTFYQRYKETSTAYASPASVATLVTNSFTTFTITSEDWGDYSVEETANGKVVTIAGTFVRDGVLYKTTSVGSYSLDTFNDQVPCPFEIILPETITTLEEAAIAQCDAKRITIPSGVSVIPKDAFFNSSLLEITFRGDIVEIGNTAFHGIAMTHFDIPSTVTKFGNNIFQYSKLQTVTIPETMTVIPYGMFKDCPNLTGFVLPDHIVEIEAYAFATTNTNSLTDYSFPIESIGPVGSGADFEIPASVQKIGAGAFQYNEKLTDVVLPDTVSMGDSMFYGCTNLKTVQLPAGITKIPYGTFANCNSLTSFIIPDGVVEIGGFAFGNGKFKSVGPTGSDAAIQIPASVKTIGASAFTSCHNLTDVVVPDTVERLESRCFGNCTWLMRLTIGSGVNYIGPTILDTYSDSKYILKTVTMKDSTGWVDKTGKAIPVEYLSVPETAKKFFLGTFYGINTDEKYTAPLQKLN